MFVKRLPDDSYDLKRLTEVFEKSPETAKA